MKLVDLKLDYPCDSRIIDQGFGGNAVDAYAAEGLKGHPGIDFHIDWGKPIYSASKGLGKVYRLYNQNNPDLSKYRAPVEYIELEDCFVELTYGHCDHINCQLGSVIPREPIATVGNTGEVYYGTELITEAEKEKGSHRGAHLHFQMRIMQKVTHTTGSDIAIQLLDDGSYLVAKQNGFNGCVNPLPYFDTTPDDIAALKAKRDSLLTQALSLAYKVLAILQGRLV